MDNLTRAQSFASINTSPAELEDTSLKVPKNNHYIINYDIVATRVQSKKVCMKKQIALTNLKIIKGQWLSCFIMQ